MQGQFIVGDYKGNQIKRFSVEPDGAGFTLQWQEPILRSRHRNFRPVDVKVGPDGAIYVVDWYNPITCHQDDAYRDPSRDKAHGRIWRLSASKPTVKPPNLAKTPLADVLDALTSPEHWTRYQAKRALTVRDTSDVIRALGDWVQSLDPVLPIYEHLLVEALGAYATIEAVEPGLLRKLLRAQDPQARAYTARIVGRWHDRVGRPLELLAPLVQDRNPLVRMEAVMACAAIPSPQSIEVAARVVDEPMDEWTTYALQQTVRHLQPHWLPAFQRGEVSFANSSQLAAVLNETGGPDVLMSLKQLVDSPEVPARARASAIAAIVAVGGPSEWRHYGLDASRFTHDGTYDVVSHTEALQRVIEAARLHGTPPGGDLAPLIEPLIGAEHLELQDLGLTLAGLWKVEGLRDRVLAVGRDDTSPIAVRTAAFRAMVEMKLPECQVLFAGCAQAPHPPSLRSAAIQALTDIDPRAAADHAADLLSESNVEPAVATALIAGFLNRSGGDEALASSLRSRSLTREISQQLIRSLFATGQPSQVLFAAFNEMMGASTDTPDYSEELVNRLTDGAHRSGEAERGSVLFKSMACITCHRVGDDGGNIGPELTAIGTTLSPERIIEELLWPHRQIKEGYSVLQVVTEEGRIIQGFERRTKESQAAGDLLLKELSTGELVKIEKLHIEEQRVAGSAMPIGLTAALSEPQLLDLIRYLSELGKIK
jgi:putative heme-binding domain-containing protein